MLRAYVETWHRACADFVALARALPPEDWHRPTDLTGWDVQDIVAHTAHLEAVLAGAPEETAEVLDAPHVTGLTGYYTEQGVLARREQSMGQLVDEIEESVAKRYAALQADPPTDGRAAPPKTPGDVPWTTETLLRNRPLDVWMHEQDIRRAVGRPGGYDSPAARHTVTVLGAGLPMVLGKRVAPPAGSSVLLEVPAADFRTGAVVGDDGRAVASTDLPEPTARITLEPEAFVVLAGGRRTPDTVDATVEGDTELAAQVLARLAVTP